MEKECSRGEDADQRCNADGARGCFDKLLDDGRIDGEIVRSKFRLRPGKQFRFVSQIPQNFPSLYASRVFSAPLCRSIVPLNNETPYR
jgi:hypothetical protein